MLHVCFQSWICVITPITLQVKFFLRQIWIYRKILFVCVCGRLAVGIWRSALLTTPGHKVSTRLSICLLVRLISACWVTQVIKIYLIVSSSALFAPRKILFVLQKKYVNRRQFLVQRFFFFIYQNFSSITKLQRCRREDLEAYNFLPGDIILTLGNRGFSSRATGSFVSSAEGRNRKPRMKSLWHPGYIILDSCPSSGHLISWTWPIDLFSLYLLFPNTGDNTKKEK